MTVAAPMAVRRVSPDAGAAAPRRRVVISCENIHKTYLLGTEGVPALRGVTLDVYEGEFCVIYGTSGGGKTTLLNILGTIDTPTKGNIAAMGRRITARTPDTDLADLRLHTLGFVFQTFNLLGTLTAAENVAVPMILSGRLSAQERADRVHELLASVGMSQRETHYPNMLSGGEQQRVTIARAMANRPRVLLLDEPTGDLDTRNTKIVLDLLMRLNKEQGVTLIMVTHDPELKNFAHRAVYVRDGKIGGIEDIAPEVNARALTKLSDYLSSAGAMPDRRASPLVPSAGHSPLQPGVGVLLPGGLEAGTRPTAPPAGGAQAEEVRRPEDYETFCDEGLDVDDSAGRQPRGRQSLFRQLFAEGAVGGLTYDAQRRWREAQQVGGGGAAGAPAAADSPSRQGTGFSAVPLSQGHHGFSSARTFGAAAGGRISDAEVEMEARGASAGAGDGPSPAAPSQSQQSLQVPGQGVPMRPVSPRIAAQFRTASGFADTAN